MQLLSKARCTSSTRPRWVGNGTGTDLASVTLSFPLASMLYYPEADVLTVRVTESNKKGNMVVRSYDLPGGQKQR